MPYHLTVILPIVNAILLSKILASRILYIELHRPRSAVANADDEHVFVAEHGLHPLDVCGGVRAADIRDHSAGKPAAVNARREHAGHPAADRKPQRNALSGVAERIAVLQQLIGASAALVDHLAELDDVACADGVERLFDAPVLIEEVYRAQDRPAAHLALQLGDVLPKLAFVYAAKRLCSHRRRYVFHLRTDGRILIGEVGVVAAGVGQDDVEIGESPFDIGDLKIFDGLEVDVADPAKRDRTLIEQPARLAEVDVLGILSSSRLCDGVDRRAVVHDVEDLANEQLKTRRRADARPVEHVRGRRRGKTADVVAVLLVVRDDAAHERFALAVLVSVGQEIVNVNLDDGIANRGDNDLALERSHASEVVNTDRRAQHLAVVVVGVVADDLDPARRRKERAALAEVGGMFVVEHRVSVRLIVESATVKSGDGVAELLAVFELLCSQCHSTS